MHRVLPGVLWKVLCFLQFYASASLRAPVHPPPPPAGRNIDFIATKCDRGASGERGPEVTIRPNERMMRFLTVEMLTRTVGCTTRTNFQHLFDWSHLPDESHFNVVCLDMGCDQGCQCGSG